MTCHRFLCTLSLIYDEIHIKKLFIFPICPKQRINIYTISDMHIECQNLLLISRGCFFIGFLPEKNLMHRQKVRILKIAIHKIRVLMYQNLFFGLLRDHQICFRTNSASSG